MRKSYQRRARSSVCSKNIASGARVEIPLYASRPLRGLKSFIRFPAVETAGYYQPSRFAGLEPSIPLRSTARDPASKTRKKTIG
jgi:hypothetical protein